MTSRITNADLAHVAERLTRAMHRHNLIEPWQRVRVGGAYGGVRFEISGHPAALIDQFGDDRDAWPEGWSGVTAHNAAWPQGYDSKRATYDVGRLVAEAWEVVS